MKNERKNQKKEWKNEEKEQDERWAEGKCTRKMEIMRLKKETESAKQIKKEK